VIVDKNKQSGGDFEARLKISVLIWLLEPQPKLATNFPGAQACMPAATQKKTDIDLKQ
jgi:hypothetical protein